MGAANIRLTLHNNGVLGAMGLWWAFNIKGPSPARPALWSTPIAWIISLWYSWYGALEDSPAPVGTLGILNVWNHGTHAIQAKGRPALWRNGWEIEASKPLIAGHALMHIPVITYLVKRWHKGKPIGNYFGAFFAKWIIFH